MRINNPAPFRIQKKTDSVSEWSDTPPTERTRTQRVLVGQNSADQWVSTVFPDFNTLTFRHVSDLFESALADTQQTALLVNRLICRAPTPAHFRMSESALRVLRCENAGGASEFSEAVSMELLHRVFGAVLERTEMAIEYEWSEWSKKTDYTCRINGQVVAVSVTRAMKFAGEFTETDAFNLLFKKLHGCQMSNRDVVAEHRWSKQVLHVLTEQHYIVDLLRSVFSWFLKHSPELVGDTVVLITLAVDAPFLFWNFCADQAHMQFVHTAEAEPVADSAEAFTTPACAEASMPLCFEHAEDEDDAGLFFYGFSTRAEALAHNAVAMPLGPKEDIWDGEGLDCLFGGDEDMDVVLGAPSIIRIRRRSRRIARLPKALPLPRALPDSPLALAAATILRRLHHSHLGRVHRRDRNSHRWGQHRCVVGVEGKRGDRKAPLQPLRSEGAISTRQAAAQIAAGSKSGSFARMVALSIPSNDQPYRSYHSLLRSFMAADASAPVSDSPVTGSAAIFSSTISAAAMAAPNGGCFAKPYSFIGDNADSMRADDDCSAALAAMFSSRD